MSEQDELLTTDEVAAILKVQSRTVSGYITQGKLAAVDLEGSYRVYRHDLQAFLAKRYKRPEEKPREEKP